LPATMTFLYYAIRPIRLAVKYFIRLPPAALWRLAKRRLMPQTISRSVNRR